MFTIILNHLYLKSQKLAHFIEIQVMHIITDAAYDEDTPLDIVMNIILFVDRLFITNNYMMTMNWIGIYKLIILFIKVYIYILLFKIEVRFIIFPRLLFITN